MNDSSLKEHITKKLKRVKTDDPKLFKAVAMAIFQIEVRLFPIPLRAAIWHGWKICGNRKQVEYWIRKCYPPRFWITENGKRWARYYPKEAQRYREMKNTEKWLETGFRERIRD